jgi:hypothetical protein
MWGGHTSWERSKVANSIYLTCLQRDLQRVSVVSKGVHRVSTHREGKGWDEWHVFETW